MKKLTLLVFLLVVSFGFKCLAQESIINDVNYDLLQKYIQSAKENYIPKKIVDKRVEGAKTAIPVAALSYLDILNVSYIFRPNDQTAIVTPVGAGTTNTSNPYAVNGFQFGVNLSLGSFLEKPFIIKKARLDYESAKLDADEFNNTLEVEVKTRYYNYIQAVAQLKLSSQNLQDITIIAEGINTKFQKAEVSLDVYDQSRLSLTSAKNVQITVEGAFLKARDALEQIIGKKLSEIK